MKRHLESHKIPRIPLELHYRTEKEWKHNPYQVSPLLWTSEILREGGIHPVPLRSCLSGGSLKKIQVMTPQEERLERSCPLFLVELKQGLNLQLNEWLRLLAPFLQSEEEENPACVLLDIDGPPPKSLAVLSQHFHGVLEHGHDCSFWGHRKPFAEMLERIPLPPNFLLQAQEGLETLIGGVAEAHLPVPSLKKVRVLSTWVNGSNDGSIQKEIWVVITEWH
ncbi:uncharacterized protein LOC103059399 [Python bivittatus]|uniref:Uncharacterized protein LOC103059399 n=1 Tax=Python bivittatus TaxID=176946 RepID=A0A9F5J2L2_PYTBI|nr:uncharacterized protein LOC103059399 [Python bivittatus]